MYEYKAKVNKIIDGDTIVLDIDLGFDIWLNNQYVRLAGLDTPELKSKDKGHRAAGLLAKEKLTALFKDVEFLTLKSEDYEPEEDKYGRILGTLWLPNGTNVNTYLLNNKLAVPYSGQNKGETMKAHAVNIEFLINKGEIKL